MKVTMLGEFNLQVGGIGRYSLDLAKHLEDKGIKVDTIGRKGKLDKFFLKAIGRTLNTNSDIVHITFPTYGKIRTNKPIVVTFHDDLFITRYKEARDFLREYLEKSTAIYTLSRADAILPNSSLTMKSLENFMESFKIDKTDKIIRTISIGINDAFIKEKPCEGERRDFVYIGDIFFPHKNFPFLLQVFSRLLLSNQDLKLHIFTSSKDAQEILNKELEKYVQKRMFSQVILHYKAPDEEVIEYTKKAIALLHFSKEEGFGLPILEAMALGTPVVLLKDAKIPEEVSKYAYKVENEPFKAEEFINKLIDKPTALSKEAIDYAKSFTWERTASETLKVYEEVLKNKHIEKIKLVGW